MPFISPAPTMPEGFEGFPWADLLHLWDYGLGYAPCLRFVLWYPPVEADSEILAASRSWLVHLDVWEWFAERYHFTKLPEFEVYGEPVLRKGVWTYERVAHVGTFSLCRPLSSRASR